MVTGESSRELLSNNSLHVLVGTRFSSDQARREKFAVVLNNKQCWACDTEGYGPKIEHILFQSQLFIIVLTHEVV